MAYIVWSTVTDTIFMVTKDQPIRSDSFSNFYVSHDYGKHFNLNNNLLGSGLTSVEDIYTSPASGSTVRWLSVCLSVFVPSVLDISLYR